MIREETLGFVEEENAPNTERSNTIQRLDKCVPQATAKLGLRSETENKVSSLVLAQSLKTYAAAAMSVWKRYCSVKNLMLIIMIKES